jgi:hypothetical protein
MVTSREASTPLPSSFSVLAPAEIGKKRIEWNSW